MRTAGSTADGAPLVTQQEDPQLLNLLISVFAGGGAVFQVTPGTGAIELLGGGLAVPEFRDRPTLRSALRCLSVEEVRRLLVAWREAERFRRSRLVHRIHLPDSSGGRWYQLRLAIDWGDEGPRRVLGWLSDITMSQVAAEERDKLFQLSTDMLCVLGPDGYFRRFNDSWTRHLGLTPLNLITQPLADLISEEDRDRFSSALADSLASGEAIADLEVTLERPGGSPLAVSWSSVVSDGRCYGIARDITERRRQAAQLEEANRRLSADLRRDGLTGLANTRLLKEYLGSALPRAGRRGNASRWCLSTWTDSSPSMTGLATLPGTMFSGRSRTG